MKIHISAKHARAIVSEMPHPLLDEAIASIKAQLRPKPAVKARRQVRAQKKATRKEETAAIRLAVFNRSGGNCECGCGRFVDWVNGQLDHFFSRREAQTERNTWYLHPDCHRAKTDGKPSRNYWLIKFAAHCAGHRFEAERRRAQAMREGEDLIAAAENA